MEFGNILHGTTSDDYFEFLGIMSEKSIHKLKETPVMFVFENPGRSENDDFFSINRRRVINKTWPYIGWSTAKPIPKVKPSDFIYEDEISHQRRYGSLICSVILKYRSKNAYVTNLVKCGNIQNKNMKDYADRNRIIDSCFESFLFQEIEAIKPQIIFAFGDLVYSELIKRKQQIDNVILVPVPHPASRISNKKRAYVLNEAFDMLDAFE